MCKVDWGTTCARRGAKGTLASTELTRSETLFFGGGGGIRPRRGGREGWEGRVEKPLGRLWGILAGRTAATSL